MKLQVYNDYVERLKVSYDIDKNSGFISNDVLKRWKNTINKMDKGLEQYSPHINTTLLKHSRRMKLEFTVALKEIKQNPAVYETLKRLLNKHNQGQDEVEKSFGEVFKKTYQKQEKSNIF